MDVAKGKLKMPNNDIVHNFARDRINCPKEYLKNNYGALTGDTVSITESTKIAWETTAK